MTTPDSPVAGPAALLPVLIAEDEPTSRRLLEATLRRWGHEVVVTVDGAGAWAALRRPDTDAQFSHGVGPQCYEQILAPQLRAMREARTEPPRNP